MVATVHGEQRPRLPQPSPQARPPRIETYEVAFFDRPKALSNESERRFTDAPALSAAAEEALEAAGFAACCAASLRIASPVKTSASVDAVFRVNAFQ